MGCFSSKRRVQELAGRVQELVNRVQELDETVSCLEIQLAKMVAREEERAYKDSLKEAQHAGERRRLALDWHRQQYLKTHPNYQEDIRTDCEGEYDEID